MNGTRNIGGSILPSSCDQILTSIETRFGTLVVRRDEEADTHRLTLSKDEGIVEVCSHPNGYSCHALAQRLAGVPSGPWPSRGSWEEQAEYIVDCGGTCLPCGEIAKLVG